VAPLLKGKEKQRQEVTLLQNLKPKNKTQTHFEGELNPNLVSDFAQCNLKSHPSHPNVSKLCNLIKNQAQSLDLSSLWKHEHLSLVLSKK